MSKKSDNYLLKTELVKTCSTRAVLDAIVVRSIKEQLAAKKVIVRCDITGALLLALVIAYLSPPLTGTRIQALSLPRCPMCRDEKLKRLMEQLTRCFRQCMRNLYRRKTAVTLVDFRALVMLAEICDSDMFTEMDMGSSHSGPNSEFRPVGNARDICIHALIKYMTREKLRATQLLRQMKRYSQSTASILDDVVKRIGQRD